MKKIVSLILAGLMSVSLFAIGASAETIAHGTKTTVVGANGGVTPDKWTGTTENGSDINVKVDKIVHKYAVDLTFTFDALEIGGATWNVETMRYDLDKELKNQEHTITVTNRSDLPVSAYATITDGENKAVGVNVTSDHTGTDNKLTVAAATPGVGSANGSATDDIIKVTVASMDWTAVANHYIGLITNAKAENNLQNTTYKLATVTITLSKVADNMNTESH